MIFIVSEGSLAEDDWGAGICELPEHDDLIFFVNVLHRSRRKEFASLPYASEPGAPGHSPKVPASREAVFDWRRAAL